MAMTLTQDDIDAIAAAILVTPANKLAVDGLLRGGEVAAAAWFSSHRSDVSQWPQSTLTAIDTVAETVSLTPLRMRIIGT